METVIRHLLRKPDISGIYFNTNPRISKKLFSDLQKRFGTFRKIAKYLSVDESNLRKWRRTGKISVSAIQRLSRYPETKIAIQELEKNVKYLSVQTSPHKISIPTLVPELAYLVGYISGDGHLKRPINNKWEITIESWTDRKTLETLNNMIYKNFGIRGSLTKNNTRDGWRLYINSRIIYIIFNEIFEIPEGKKSDKMKTPKMIKGASVNIQKKYIQGWYDAEGFVTSSHGRPQIEFYINNKNIIFWINKQLNSFGIKTYKKKRGTIIISSRNIQKFSETVGFRHGKQLKKLFQAR